MSRAVLSPKPSLASANGKSAAVTSLIAQFDQFLECAVGRAETHPWIVVMAMHEVFRNLYPADPFLPFDAGESHRDRISRVMAECEQRLGDAGDWPSYFACSGLPLRGPTTPMERPEAMPHSSSPTEGGRYDRTGESDTQKLYGSLWDQFDTNVYIEEATRILRERFAGTDFLDSVLPGSILLDAGCGSGRYAMALARMCPAQVIGLDLGATSLGHAQRIAKEAGIANIEFRTGSVLKLPFADASIDCVFSNGVLHHTGDTMRGLREMYRVLRPGGRAFLYLYGAGGLFWHARRAAREVMKRIPRDYAADVLRMIGMPANRFIFMDTWYVPIEEHIGRDALETLLGGIGFGDVQKMVSRRATDLDSAAIMKDPDFASIWGDGEHRYLLTKRA